jgi:signal transduction histidine kinase
VVVRYTDHDVTVDVRDDGRGPTGPTGDHGHGLIGMRERVAVHGGELVAGPTNPDGGFSVTARLPFETSETC